MPEIECKALSRMKTPTLLQTLFSLTSFRNLIAFFTSPNLALANK